MSTATRVARGNLARVSQWLHSERSTESYRRAFWITIFLLSILKLWLVSAQTVYAIGPAAHDDRLFLDLGEHVSSGRWLGGYNEMTLAKGPFYSMWIGVLAFYGLPLFTSQHLLYIGACLVVVLALRPVRMREPLVITAFALLLFEPMTFTHLMLRTIREGIYPALTLFVAALTIGILLRRERAAREVLPWSIGLAIAMAAFWLTREEGIWLAPMPALLILILPILRRERRAAIVRTAVAAAIPFVLAAVLVGTVAIVNWVKYGLPTTVEFRQQDFVDAYGALTRVEHEHWLPTVPIPREVWRRLFDVSPAFAELCSFEDEIHKVWGDPSIGGSIHGGWTMWALRSAVAAAGYHRSAATAAGYYRRLAKEVNDACDRGQIRCGPGRSSFLPPWHRDYLEPVISSLFHAISYLASLRDFSAQPALSVGPEYLLHLFADMTRERLSPMPEHEQRRLITGWLFSKSLPLRLSIRDAQGQLADGSIRMEASPDVFAASVGPDGRGVDRAREARFAIETSCADCVLYVHYEDVLVTTLLLDSAGCGSKADLAWCLAGQQRTPKLRIQHRADRNRIEVLEAIGRGYQIALPVLIVVAILAVVWSTRRSWQARSLIGFLPISMAIIIAIGARLLILSLITVTSFGAINPIYLAPAYSLAILFVVTSLLDLVIRPIPWLLARQNGRRDADS